MRKTLTLVLAGLTTLSLGAGAYAEDYITLASTTSTENSGLFNAILPQFKAATNIGVTRNIFRTCRFDLRGSSCGSAGPIA
jgi:tungstate transport system substrate-binding protein